MTNIVFYDIETTGLEWAEHRVIEVALVVCDLKTRKEKLRFEQRVDPQRSIQAKAQEVHKISSADLIGEPLWSEVGPKVHRILSACQISVAHNGVGFDHPFLTSEFARIGLAMPAVPVFDTLLEGRLATPTGAVPNLQALCFAFDVNYDPELAHAALYDVDVMKDCFFRGLDWGYFRLPETVSARMAA